VEQRGARWCLARGDATLEAMRSSPLDLVRVAAFAALAVSVPPAIGCTSNDSSASGGGGTAGAGGGGGAGGASALGPTDFLEPASYDCRAAGALPEPGPRPHALGCLFDRACTSDFVCAHRLGNPFAPENSLSALRASILLGVDVVETDARITADGRVVLVHDAEVDRTLEGSGDVSSFTLAELEAMAVKPEGSDPAGDFACERVATIEQVMAIAKGRVIVELETKDVAAGVAAAQYLAAEGLERDAFIQCTPDECDAVRAAVPDAPIMVRVRSEADLALAEAYDPPPFLVEIDPGVATTDPSFVERIHAMGAKAFTDVFISGDGPAIIAGDYAGYTAPYAEGLDVLQSELAHLALWQLGRIAPVREP
jgi:glycerophosphoryl diester phosphodiesterase